MLPPTPIALIQARLEVHEAEAATPCTCGAKHFMQRRKKQQPRGTSEAKQAANGSTADKPKLHRSLWRKLLGKGPKCVCQKRRTNSTTKPGLVQIPTEYVGCTSVTVAGKRVPFSRDMQQLRRASWTPLDAIDEGE
ncbi:hypothetical protein PHYBOEH_007823 [Phytophthora boehmeriae]|uniref:Uncharacterized protein n=1 Tax=Phytophthora boehmeriae TaxID=109152 RepID=A0A8T1X3G0_9STRA|nr:hypothetical protein PHYBOEH_007823 [Phytophthora boehmeriae]